MLRPGAKSPNLLRGVPGGADRQPARKVWPPEQAIHSGFFFRGARTVTFCTQGPQLAGRVAQGGPCSAVGRGLVLLVDTEILFQSHLAAPLPFPDGGLERGKGPVKGWRGAESAFLCAQVKYLLFS